MFILKRAVTVTLKLVFSKRLVVFAHLSRKHLLRRIYSTELKFSGFVFMSAFYGISIELFPAVHSVEVIQ